MPEDAALIHKVKELLEKDEVLGALLPHLHLRAVGGVVFLDGEAGSDEELEALEAKIREIEGVKWVQNRLQVRAPDTPTDREPHRHGG